MIITEQLARKVYDCCVCKEPIKIGNPYIRESLPAWQDVEADVDDEGRDVAVEKPRSERRWYVNRRHAHCSIY